MLHKLEKQEQENFVKKIQNFQNHNRSDISNGIVSDVSGNEIFNSNKPKNRHYLNGISQEISNDDKMNAGELGSVYPIDSLTQVSTEVIKELHLTEENLPDLCPINIGRAPYFDTLKTRRTSAFNLDWKKGLSSAQVTQAPSVEIGETSFDSKRSFWVVSGGESVFEAKQTQIGGIDYMQEKMQAMKKQYDNLIEGLIFAGAEYGKGGMLTTSEFNVNTTLINKTSGGRNGLAAMDDTEFEDFLTSYRETFANNSQTYQVPEIFEIPQDEYIQLSEMTYTHVTAYPMTRLKRLELENRIKVVPSKFLKKEINGSLLDINNGAGKQCYILKTRDAFDFDLPISFSIFNEIETRAMKHVVHAYAQVGELVVKRPEFVIRFENPSAV